MSLNFIYAYNPRYLYVSIYLRSWCNYVVNGVIFSASWVPSPLLQGFTKKGFDFFGLFPDVIWWGSCSFPHVGLPGQQGVVDVAQIQDVALESFEGLKSLVLMEVLTRCHGLKTAAFWTYMSLRMGWKRLLACFWEGGSHRNCADFLGAMLVLYSRRAPNRDFFGWVSATPCWCCVWEAIFAVAILFSENASKSERKHVDILPGTTLASRAKWLNFSKASLNIKISPKETVRSRYTTSRSSSLLPATDSQGCWNDSTSPKLEWPTQGTKKKKHTKRGQFRIGSLNELKEFPGCSWQVLAQRAWLVLMHIMRTTFRWVPFGSWLWKGGYVFYKQKWLVAMNGYILGVSPTH